MWLARDEGGEQRQTPRPRPAAQGGKLGERHALAATLREQPSLEPMNTQNQKVARRGTWQPRCATPGTASSTMSGPFWWSSRPIQPMRGTCTAAGRSSSLNAGQKRHGNAGQAQWILNLHQSCLVRMLKHTTLCLIHQAQVNMMRLTAFG